MGREFSFRFALSSENGTGVETLERTELDEWTEFESAHDWATPCQGRPHIEDCDSPAEWVALFNCGHERLWCERHKALFQSFENGYCAQCYPPDGKTYPVATIVYLERVGGH